MLRSLFVPNTPFEDSPLPHQKNLPLSTAGQPIHSAEKLIIVMVDVRRMDLK